MTVRPHPLLLRPAMPTRPIQSSIAMTLPPLPADLAGDPEFIAQPPANPVDDWLGRMDEICGDDGYVEALGRNHWAVFHETGPALLVTFERLETVLDQPGQLPLGLQIARQFGWSHLCILSNGESWYRDPRVYGYVDRLSDDAFFEDFEQVLFYGAGTEAYAACAFAVAAPGATVLAMSARASMSPAVAGWDRRHVRARGLDFTRRYGYAPDMVEAAAKVFLAYDPRVSEDAMHAALFRGDHVERLRLPYTAGQPQRALEQIGALGEVMAQAMNGSLDRSSFARIWRGRRDHGGYLRSLLADLDRHGRHRFAKALCSNVTARLQAPRFHKRLAELEAIESAQEKDMA